jgi:hypothetical protein
VEHDIECPDPTGLQIVRARERVVLDSKSRCEFGRYCTAADLTSKSLERAFGGSSAAQHQDTIDTAQVR